MTHPIFENLVLRRQDRILYASFNRPDELNAFNRVLEGEFVSFINFVTHDDATDVVVLDGKGKAFCAGGDVAFMQENIDRPERFNITIAKQLVFAMLDCPKPIIAKVNGDAVGLGATIALLCDVIFADETARIGDPHVRMGYVAGDGGAVIWPQLIGFARAKEYLLTGDLMTGVEAARLGLINHAVAAADLDARVDAFAAKLARGATIAIQGTKMSVNIALKQIATSVMDASMAYESLSNRSEDHREALTAFKEKRRPKFIGK